MRYARYLLILTCLLFPMVSSPAETHSAQRPADGTATSVLISLTGDCVLGGEEKTRKDPRSFDNVLAQKGMTWPFSGLEPVFAEDDLTLANLECVLKDNTRGRLTDKQHTFRGSTAYTEILRLGHVEKVNVANNHSIDYGQGGRESTLKALQEAKIAYSGYKELHMATINGKKIGFGGIRETVYRQNRNIMAEDMQKLKEMGCDIIVYSCHFGKEYSRTHNDLQQKMAREAIDLGAALVVGTHPHVVQGVESYKGGVILYSLGNFVFGGNLDLMEFDGCVAQAEFQWKGQEYQGVLIRLIPVMTTGAVPGNDFRPIIATGEDKERILKKMQADSKIRLQETMFFPHNGK